MIPNLVFTNFVQEHHDWKFMNQHLDFKVCSNHAGKSLFPNLMLIFSISGFLQNPVW